MNASEAEQYMKLATQSTKDQRQANQAVTDSLANWAALEVLRNAAASVVQLNKAITENPTQ